ncbi:MAG: DUF616 domain-containing protein [Bacillota bacterium]|nr:DUF616 domain-containing protein [Bacillota bacterium]
MAFPVHDSRQYIEMIGALEEKARADHRASQQKSLSAIDRFKRKFRRKPTQPASPPARSYTVMKNIPDNDLALDRGTAADRGTLYFSDKTIAVYTALFGSYDDLTEPLITPDNIRYFVITDQKVPENSKWEPISPDAVLPDDIKGDDIMSNRWCKMHPHLLFPEFDQSVYCDANIHIVSDMTPLTAGLGDYPLAMFRHKRRDCVYDEVYACITQRKASESDLRRHEDRLKSAGIPDHWGLLEAPIIARSHKDPLCIQLMDCWWDLFCSGSRRDQLSLIETLWHHNIPPETVGTLGGNVTGCRLFIMMAHRT